jgi:hypothetical protein
VKQLFDGEFAPTTSGFALLRVSFASLVDTYAAWARGNHPQLIVSHTPKSLRDALEQMGPLTMPATRELLAGTVGEWTALMSNGLTNDSYARVAYWAPRLGVDAVAFDCKPDEKDDEPHGPRVRYRSIQIQVFERGKLRRTLGSVRDGNRWVFLNEGTPFLVETPAKYSARSVRSRVAACDILAILNCLDAPYDERLYSGPFLMMSTNRSALRSLSYREARLEMS